GFKTGVGKLAEPPGQLQQSLEFAVRGAVPRQTGVQQLVKLFRADLVIHLPPSMEILKFSIARNCNCLTAPSERSSSTAISRILFCSTNRITITWRCMSG